MSKQKKDLGQKRDLSTEEKIKAAAKKIFTKKGFAATRTRDIAEEAGINLALLNYYFRSKEKLFELVMRDNIQLFIGSLMENINSNPRPFEAQLDFLVSSYIDMLLENPDLPFFVLNLLQSGYTSRSNPENILFENPNESLFKSIQTMRSSLLKHIQEEMDRGSMKKMHPLHVIANMMSLMIFPFIASSLLMARAGNISRKEFEALMQERKKLIPEWIKGMLYAK
jgi:AcrR family transcriptional regulator